MRRQADSVARSASVGIALDVPKAEAFGTPELEELSSKVRSLGNDPVSVTAFRMMWPLDERWVGSLANGGAIKRSELAPEELDQLLFLSAWYAFLEDGQPADVEEALRRWHDLAGCVAFRERLAELLVREDDVAEGLAGEVVARARETLTLHLLERVSKAAAAAWDRQDLVLAARLTASVTESGFDESLVERVLEPMAEAAGRLVASVEEHTEKASRWLPGDPLARPKAVETLALLGELLKRWHPAAPTWLEAVDCWQNIVIGRMLDAATRLLRQGRGEEALELLHNAKRIAVDSDHIRVVDELIGETRQQMSRTAVPNGCLHSLIDLSKRLIGIWLVMAVGSFLIKQCTVDRSTSPDYDTTSLSTPYSGADNYAGSYSQDQPAVWDPAAEEESRRRQEAEERFARLEDELAQLKEEIAEAEQWIEAESDRLDLQRQSLDQVEAWLIANEPDPTDWPAVDAYNEVVDGYEKSRKRHNREVSKYNNFLAHYRKKIDRHNVIVNVLNTER